MQISVLLVVSLTDNWLLCATQPKEVQEIIKGFGLSKPVERLSQAMDKLSGGWRMRAALAHALVDTENTDILLLDEPTNHCE